MARHAIGRVNLALLTAVFLSVAWVVAPPLAQAQEQKASAPAQAPTQVKKSPVMININKATAEELDRLPGIGPAKAKAIIDYRNANGDFKTNEDIQKVKGIKAGEFSKIRDYIRLTD